MAFLILLTGSLLAPASAGAAGKAPVVAAADEPLRPWDFDPAPEEAARKIAFYERLTRAAVEPTANQIAADARYYDLDIEIDPNSGDVVAGTLTARLQVSGPGLSQVDLDLASGLVVAGVTVGGTTAPYTHAADLLSITLDRTYLQGEQIEVAVAYAGTPPASFGAFGVDTYGGQPMIWTLSEPFGARSWWPCDDWSDDKADSMDLHITVPTGLVVASNGILRGVVDDGATETYTWHEGYPIATYLVSLAIHPYTVSTDYYVAATDDSLEIRFYMFPDHAAEYADENAMTRDMIAYFATIYGEYPFMGEKYGHAEFLWGGGMEHQTCTSLGAFYESIIAHELAHQWWGDMVTCADFHHIWLNEGFARYAEALWFEEQYGNEGYWGRMNAIRYYGEGTIYVPELSDGGRIFHTGLTYNKAAWVVHMLRGVMGDEVFGDFLLAYRQAFEFGAATTEGLQAVAESVSGMDLQDFFQQWIYGEFYPVYEFVWENAPTPEGERLHLTIDQTQTNAGSFHMPIQVRVEMSGGDMAEFVVDNALAHEEYWLALSAPAAAVEIDPDEWILRRVLEPVNDPSFASGVLLVNGVDWDTYGSELTSAYEDRAFWGDLEIDFWDYFTKSGAYPLTLPAPLGHGRVPADVLGDYLAVIWVGNNYDGDLDGWMNSSIQPYLEAGGNVLLMSRQGDQFLDEWMRDYLGIAVTGTDLTLYDCISVHPQLGTIGRIGTQSYCMHFSRSLTQSTSSLLFEARQNYNPDAGIGVIRVPEQGGTHNFGGGQFAFLSGRPYRWQHAALAADVETIVGWFESARANAPGEQQDVRDEPRLWFASPTRGRAAIGFSLAAGKTVRLGVYDSQGRLVREICEGLQGSGEHRREWDGRTVSGARAPSGIYWVKLQPEGMPALRRPMLLLR
ncbi:MAG: M1 family aminopeptidase [Candidatus Eisenbacteria bacterium]